MEKKKLKILNGVVDSLFNLECWRNPLFDQIFSSDSLAKINFEIDLLNGKIKPFRDDTFGEIYSWKSEWFLDFLQDKGFIDSIKSAKIRVKFGVEEIKIETIDGRVFEKKG